MPDWELLWQVTSRLEREGIPYALGGSGLLWSLGLTDTVRDWDLTTDEPLERVVEALKGLKVEVSEAGGHPFGSAYKLEVGAEASATDGGSARKPGIEAGAAVTDRGNPLGSVGNREVGDGAAAEPVDLIGRFALYSDKGLCRMPTLAVARWNGVAVGSPEVWFAAYTLMGREAKAQVLGEYLGRTGCCRDTVERLLKEPLPDELLEKLLGLLGYGG